MRRIVVALVVLVAVLIAPASASATYRLQPARERIPVKKAWESVAARFPEATIYWCARRGPWAVACHATRDREVTQILQTSDPGLVIEAGVVWVEWLRLRVTAAGVTIDGSGYAERATEERPSQL